MRDETKDILWKAVSALVTGTICAYVWGILLVNCNQFPLYIAGTTADIVIAVLVNVLVWKWRDDGEL
jgi:Na+-driven multidrug efflux pump